jgi:hypothetical protein
MNQVVLCETAADVRSAAALAASGARLIALAPEAWFEARTRRLRCEMLEDFYDERALTELREPVLARQLAWMDEVDAVLWQHVPFAARHRLSLTRLWFYSLKHLLDPPVMLAFTLRALFEKVQPSVVHVSAVPPRQPSWDRVFRVKPHERVELPHGSPAAVALQLARARGIDVVPLSVDDAATSGPPAGSLRRWGLLSLFRRHASGWVVDLAGLVRTFGAATLWHLARASAGRGPRLLIVRGEFDLTLVLGEAVRRGCRLDFWSRVEQTASSSLEDRDALQRVDEEATAAWKLLDGDDRFRTALIADGVDAYPMVRGGLEHFVTRAVPDAVRYYAQARAALRARHYDGMLAPGGSKGTALFAAARAEGVPIVMYQHGGFVGTCENLMWDFADFLHADCFIAWGSGVAGYVGRRRPFLPRAPVAAAAGSARLQARLAALERRDHSAVRRQLADGRARVVTYVTSLVRGYTRVITATSYPDTLAFARQVDVVRMAREFPDVTFVFKLYSNRDDQLFRAMIAAEGAENCRVVSDMPLLNVMAASDAIAVEFPSTALLEAAALPRPLAAFADRASVRLQEDAEVLLRQRALVALTHTEFVAAVRQLASGAVTVPTGPQADAFARAFAVDRTGTPAVQRAWAAVADVCGLSHTPLVTKPRSTPVPGGHP